VGVPEIVSLSDVLDPRLSPSGDEPAASVHVKGATPPASITLALYAVPTVPLGRAPEIVGGVTKSIIKDAVAAVFATEIAVTVTLVAAATLLGAL
jgi:hypothetical protein